MLHLCSKAQYDQILVEMGAYDQKTEREIA